MLSNDQGLLSNGQILHAFPALVNTTRDATTLSN